MIPMVMVVASLGFSTVTMEAQALIDPALPVVRDTKYGFAYLLPNLLQLGELGDGVFVPVQQALDLIILPVKGLALIV
jgi:hypothetical protein